MNRTHKIGRQGGWKASPPKGRRASLKHGLAAALLVMLLAQGGVVAASDHSVGAAATGVVAAIGSSVRGVIDAGAGVVRDLHQFYQITQLRDMRVGNDATPAPAPARWWKLCKAKAVPALPAMDKARS